MASKVSRSAMIVPASGTPPQRSRNSGVDLLEVGQGGRREVAEARWSAAFWGPISAPSRVLDVQH
eukprot:70767-Lingulodinium_polyedra.AAC.1